MTQDWRAEKGDERPGHGQEGRMEEDRGISGLKDGWACTWLGFVRDNYRKVQEWWVGVWATFTPWPTALRLIKKEAWERAVRGVRIQGLGPSMRLDTCGKRQNRCARRLEGDPQRVRYLRLQSS